MKKKNKKQTNKKMEKTYMFKGIEYRESDLKAIIRKSQNDPKFKVGQFLQAFFIHISLFMLGPIVCTPIIMILACCKITYLRNMSFFRLGGTAQV
jgi:hypothetical protein